ncbi:hypothetical protein VTO58DRAFT_105508 [Aureobasidium pullulans]
MDEEVSRDNAPRADHSDSSSPPSLVFDSNITDVVESTISVPANNDLTMVDSESTATAQHVTITSSAALDVAGNNLDKLPNELRQIIFKSSLYNAVRVNKAWFDSLIDHLWYKPGWGALLRPVEGRRQFYADKIRIFELDGNEPAGCQNRQYTGAKSFQLDLEDLPNMNEEHWVAQALPYLELLFELAPRLERLELLKKDDDYCKTTRAIQTAIKEIGGNGCDEDSSLYWKFSKEMVEKYKDEKDKDEKHRDENHKDDEHS